jgi:Domain of unknown function (DUF6438)
MKNTILMLLLLSPILNSCSKKNIDNTKTAKIEKEKIQTPIKSDINSNSEIESAIVKEVKLMAKINRTPCYGKCPVFTIELFDNGIVKYNGVAFVDKKGIFTAKVTPEFIANIQSQAQSIKYLSLENKYPISPVVIADLPTTTTFIRIGGEGKQITNNFDAPRDLIDFENWLEHQFEQLNWQAE